MERFENYNHGAFQGSYPANWQVTGNPNSALTIYPKGGANTDSVAYGTIISGFTPSGSSRKDLNQAMPELVASTRDTNPELRAIGHPVNITVSGRPAKSVELLGKSAILEKGGPIAERIRMVALQGKQGLVLYHVSRIPAVAG